MENKSETLTWGLTEEQLKKAKQIAERKKLKHGVFSAIPLICRVEACPYSLVCTIPPTERTIGTRCPMEIGAIMARFEMWCNYFKIDCSEDTIKDEDLVDASLIRDLVDIEIQMLRAENKIAISADFIAKTVSTVSNKGKAYYEDKISPEAEYKMSLLDKKHKILQLLNSTRKDKAKEQRNVLSPSEESLNIIDKITKKLDNIKINDK